MLPIDFPQELRTVINMEPMDFAVKAKRKNNFKDGAMFLLFGLIWSGFTSLFFAIFLGPLFLTGRVEFLMNDVPTVATWDNLEPLLFPIIFLSFFMLIGLAFLFAGVFRLLQKGGFFVGTETRLISYRNGNLQSFDWEQFNGNISVKGKNGIGNVELELRTGQIRSKGRYVPNRIKMIGIEDPFRIEQKCRVRIKENDPTPASS